MPAELADFIAWRGGDAVPEVAWRGVSIGATGPADAAVMVLVDCPDKDDDAAGRILIAARRGGCSTACSPRSACRARRSTSPRVCAKRPVAGRMPREVETQLADIAKHHIGLVAPKRLLLMGNAASRAILGAEMPGRAGLYTRLTIDGKDSVVVASFHRAS